MATVATFGIYIYPWDLLDHQKGDLLTDLGESGISRLLVAASYHAGKFLRPHAKRGRVYFPEDGAVYFPPGNEYGLLKPVEAKLTHTENYWPEWRTFGFPDLQAWVVANHNTRLGSAHPECCVVNAFDDTYPFSLCPANVEVTDYARHLCKDVSQLGVSAIKLESPGFLPYHHGFHHEFELIQPHWAREFLMGLCFCQACIQKGTIALGFSVEGLKTKVQQWIQPTWDSEGLTGEQALAQWSKLLAAEAELSQFLRWRCELVNQSLQTIGDVLPDKVPLHIIPSIQSSLALSYLEGCHFSSMSGSVGGFELPLYRTTTEAIFAELDSVLKLGLPPGKLSVILRPGYPDTPSEAALLERLEGILTRGIRNINFYNYGHLPASKWHQVARSLRRWAAA